MVAEWAIGVFPRQTILRFHSLRGHVPLWQETADTFLPVGEPFCLGYVVPFFPRPDKAAWLCIVGHISGFSLKGRSS